MTDRQETFGLADALRDRVERRLAERLGDDVARSRDGQSPSQVMFYDPAHQTFAFRWAEGDPETRWIFPVESIGPRFCYYVLKRLQDLGVPANQILVDSRGQGALFYLTPDDVEITSDLVVGLLPGNTTPYDFGSTVNAFAPGAVVTLLSDGTAGQTTYEETEYDGTQLVGQLPLYICGFASTCGCTLASDAEVTVADDGTATTPGNIWAGDPASGQATIAYPAPGEGQTQPFPLGRDTCPAP